MLHDRIKACESADLLVTKELSSLEKPAFKLLLGSTADFADHYPLQVKLKIVNYRATDTLLAIQESFQSDKEEIKQDLPMRFEDLVSILALKPCDPREGTNAEFDVWKGTHQSLFNNFCHQVYALLASKSLLAEDAADGDAVQTSFEDAMGSASKNKLEEFEANDPEAKALASFAED